MSESELGGEIGLFYNTAGVMSLFGGVAEQAVDARLRSGSIHAMRTSDGVWVYPVFQFAGADIDPRLEPAIRALRHVPGWSAGLWFVTPNPDLEGLTPLEWINDGRLDDEVAVSARRSAPEWV